MLQIQGKIDVMNTTEPHSNTPFGVLSDETPTVGSGRRPVFTAEASLGTAI